jgi:hypothetical protein
VPIPCTTREIAAGSQSSKGVIIAILLCIANVPLSSMKENQVKSELLSAQIKRTFLFYRSTMFFLLPFWTHEDFFHFRLSP